MTGTIANALDNAETIRAFLRQSSSFAGFGDDGLDLLAKSCDVDTADAGVTFFEQGDAGDFAYLILDGEVSIEVSTAVGRVIVATMGPGELVGEIAAFASTPRTAAVTSRSPVRLLRIEQSAIRDIMARSPDTAMAIIAELGSRLQGLNGTIAALTQATRALAEGAFESSMLDVLRNQATRFRQFADTFDAMAHEITSKRLHNQEMRLAYEIQQSFLPKTIDAGPLADRFTVSATMQPAKQVGGDFFDYFMIGDEWLAIATKDSNTPDEMLFIFYADSETSHAAGMASLARIGGGDPAAGAARKTTMETIAGQGIATRKFFQGEDGAFKRLGDIAVPVLVANGDQDRAFAVENSLALVRAIPNAQLAIYPDAGHAFHFQHAERFAEDVIRFLASA